MLSTFSLPKRFHIASTPLVTFRYNDLLLSKNELIHKSSQPENVSLDDTSGVCFWLNINSWLPYRKLCYNGSEYSGTLDKLSLPESWASWDGKYFHLIWSSDRPMGRRSTESSLRADSWNSVPTFQGFAWGHKSEKNVVKWFEHAFLYNCHDFRQPSNEIQLPEYEYVLAVLFYYLTFHFFLIFFNFMF